VSDTPGRDFRLIYQRRVARGEARGLSRAAASGHAREGEVSASELDAAPRTLPFLGEPGVLIVAELTAREGSRASRANRLDRRLRDGDISPGEFRRRKGNMAPIAGVKPLADPEKALALLIVTPPEDWTYVGPSSGGMRRT